MNDEPPPFPSDRARLEAHIANLEQQLTHAQAQKSALTPIDDAPAAQANANTPGPATSQSVHSGSSPTISGAVFAELIQAAPDAILLCADDGRIEYSNIQAGRLFGYPREQLLGIKIEQLLPERFRKRHVEHYQDYSKRPRSRDMGTGLSLFGLRKNGDEIPVEISLSPVTSGNQQWIATAIRDVTARQKMHNELREASRVADRASAAQSRFLAAASHDLRQPLQTLRLLHAALARSATNEDQQLLAKQSSALDAMDNVLSALLDVNQLESGRISPQHDVFQMDSVLTRLHSNFFDQAAEKGLSLRVARCSATVESDPHLLTEIAANLLSNAIKYTHLGKVLVGCRRRANTIELKVCDTGIGIDKPQRQRIFEEFCQLDNPQQDPARGRGLGLAIVERLSRAINHNVQLESIPGRGSVFTVAIPRAADRTIRTPVARQTPSAAITPGTVLYMDDDPAILDASSLLLTVAGWQVETAESADQAARLIATGVKPDIIVSDYRLPGAESGISAVSRLCSLLGEKIPAVLVTGEIGHAQRQEASQHGLSLYSKPLDGERLIEILQSLLRRPAEQRTQK